MAGHLARGVVFPEGNKNLPRFGSPIIRGGGAALPAALLMKFNNGLVTSRRENVTRFSKLLEERIGWI
jgi:hypothetical protein